MYYTCKRANLIKLCNPFIISTAHAGVPERRKRMLNRYRMCMGVCIYFSRMPAIRHCEGVRVNSRLVVKLSVLNPGYLWGANQGEMAD